MKKLFILLMAAMLLVACADDTKEPAVVEDDAAVKEEAPEQEEVKEEEPVADETPVKEEPKEEPVAEEPTKEESQGMTVEEATELIEYTGVGKDDKLNGVSVGNGEIKAVIEMAPDNMFSAEDIAVNRYSQLSDELLDHEGWETLTIEFVGVGTISMNRSEKETNEYGDYFPTLEIENRLK
ncbi:hypothetical protein [Sporosarcina sp. HYO08]|uniref:hypothetical protein n=1 Tax=Sporosarcina sp. HYO08 TaxID=1759557 RepID=UPI000799B840|nr:hypothetical protein [Sporosarcina sp. HYO08]KXH86926.1 hypothetical protein AU377_13345 [Sporosarcina sp. HYO08]